jgi:hypothetical protein
MNINIEIWPEFGFLETTKASHIVLTGARNCGKTFNVTLFVARFILDNVPNSDAVVVSSTVRNAKITVGKAMSHLQTQLPLGFLTYNASDHIYTFHIGPTDKRRVILYGYTEPKNLRGPHPVITIIDEAGYMPRDVYKSVIDPMINDENFPTKSIIMGTVNGHNQFYELFKYGMRADFPNWESYRIRGQDSHRFSSEFLKEKEKLLGKMIYAREYDCDFDADTLETSILTDLIRIAESDGRISDEIHYDPHYPVYTVWDFGFTHRTAIWFMQYIKGVVRFIDYVEDYRKYLDYYISIVLNKGYVYARAILPPDAGHENIRAPETIDRRIANYALLTSVIDGKKTRIYDGLIEARALLTVCTFDKEKCKVGIQHLKDAQYKLDRATGFCTMDPEDDEHRDCLDAFRYAAVSKYIWEMPALSKSSFRVVQEYDPLGRL